MPTDRCVNVDELCAATRMTMHSVRRRLQFWVQKRILRQSGPNEFCVNEHAADDESHATYDSVIICDEDDDREGTNAFSAETVCMASSSILHPVADGPSHSNNVNRRSFSSHIFSGYFRVHSEASRCPGFTRFSDQRSCPAQRTIIVARRNCTRSLNVLFRRRNYSAWTACINNAQSQCSEI